MSLASSSMQALGAAWPLLRATAIGAATSLTQRGRGATASASCSGSGGSGVVVERQRRFSSSASAASVPDAFADTLEIPGGR